MSTDWLPRTRHGQLDMAKNWASLFETNGTKWEIAAPEITIFTTKSTKAEEALIIAMSSERTSSTTALVDQRFSDLVAYMRFIKQRKFYKPILSNADFVALGLKPPKEKRSAVPTPVNRARGWIATSIPSVLMVQWEYLDELSDDQRSNYCVRVNYGLATEDPAAQSALTGKHYYLSEPPRSPEQLPADFSTKRRKHAIAFPAEDSGKRAWFALRVENSKGEKGPWGEMFSGIIP